MTRATVATTKTLEEVLQQGLRDLEMTIEDVAEEEVEVVQEVQVVEH